MCKLVSLIQEVNFYSSILFLMCISIDRYLAIVWAVKAHRKRRALCSWMVCLSVWVLGTVFSFPVLFNDAFKPVNSDRIVCYEYHNPESAAQWKLATRVLRHVLGFLLPLIVMLVCYGFTISRLLGTRSFEKQKAMRVIVAVVIAFLLCWMPYHLSVISDTLIRSGLISYSCETRNSIDLALFFTQSLGLLHSCINPVLYAFVGQKFRRNLLNLLYKTRVLERSSFTFDYDLSSSPCSQSFFALNSGILVSIYTFVFLLSLLGNILVIYVICCMEKQKSSTEIYLLNLAISDLFFTLTLPFWVVYENSEWIFGDFMCKLVSVMQEANFYSGILLLACISIDRYLAIVHATQAFIKKRLLVRTLCIGVWLMAALLSLPILIYRQAFNSVSRKRIICYEHINAEQLGKWRVAIRFLRHTVGFFIPLVIMVFCYGFTMKTLCQTRSGQKHRAMRVIFSVVLAFIICWLPYNVIMFVDTLMRGNVITETCSLQNQIDATMQVTQILAFMHCCINPILYAFIGQKFRNTFFTALFRHGFISKKILSTYRRDSSHYSTSGNTSTTL
ncbi:CXCR1 protein, partial [Atractosteus spatula]|nr:CXCR1 protein [Atractosteus spatula]